MEENGPREKNEENWSFVPKKIRRHILIMPARMWATSGLRDGQTVPAVLNNKVMGTKRVGPSTRHDKLSTIIKAGKVLPGTQRIFSFNLCQFSELVYSTEMSKARAI